VADKDFLARFSCPSIFRLMDSHDARNPRQSAVSVNFQLCIFNAARFSSLRPLDPGIPRFTASGVARFRSGEGGRGRNCRPLRANGKMPTHLVRRQLSAATPARHTRTWRTSESDFARPRANQLGNTLPAPAAFAGNPWRAERNGRALRRPVIGTAAHAFHGRTCHTPPPVRCRIARTARPPPTYEEMLPHLRAREVMAAAPAARHARARRPALGMGLRLRHNHSKISADAEGKITSIEPRLADVQPARRGARSSRFRARSPPRSIGRLRRFAAGRLGSGCSNDAPAGVFVLPREPGCGSHGKLRPADLQFSWPRSCAIPGNEGDTVSEIRAAIRSAHGIRRDPAHGRRDRRAASSTNFAEFPLQYPRSGTFTFTQMAMIQPRRRGILVWHGSAGVKFADHGYAPAVPGRRQTQLGHSTP